MRMWRSHPVLFTFGVGAIIGISVAAALMFTVGHFSVLTNRFLLVLWPTSILGAFAHGPRTFTLFVVVVELVSNALLYGFVFAIPVGFSVAARRSFGEPEKPPSIG
jgi:hypothetical protein